MHGSMARQRCIWQPAWDILSSCHCCCTARRQGVGLGYGLAVEIETTCSGLCLFRLLCLRERSGWMLQIFMIKRDMDTGDYVVPAAM